MKTIEEISQIYAQHCAKLGDLVFKQRKLHHEAEEVIRAIELLDQEAYAIKKATETPATQAEPKE